MSSSVVAREDPLDLGVDEAVADEASASGGSSAGAFAIRPQSGPALPAWDVLRGGAGEGDDTKATASATASASERRPSENDDNKDSDPLLSGRDGMRRAPAPTPAAAVANGGASGSGAVGIDSTRMSEAEKFDHDVRAVLLVYEHHQKMDDGYRLSRFQLQFYDPLLEDLYRRFFGLIQEHKVRLRLLGLNFLIMLYSTIEWFSADLLNPYYLVATRSVYLTLNVVLFILSLVWRETYREYIQSFCAVLISATALLVILEGYLLNIVYSPIVILVLVVYIFIAAAYVRVRYFIWLTVTVATFIVYDAFALSKVVKGDSVVKPADIPMYLIVYNILFIFLVFSVMTVSKKIELSYRIGFANALRQYRDPRNARAATSGPVTVGPGGGTTRDDKRFMPFQEVFTPLGGSKNDPAEAHSPSDLAGLMERNKYDNLLRYIDDLKRKREQAIAEGTAPHPGALRPRLANSDDPEMPEWMHPAAYIKTGYRLNYTQSDAFRSLFERHNETVNVWTEFGPMVFFTFAWITLYCTDHYFRDANVTDQGFIWAAVIMAFLFRPLLSGLAHLLHPISERAYAIWWAIDYASIVFTILFGSFVFGRFTFYCMKQQELFFIISAVGLSLSTTAAVVFITNSAVRIGSFFLYVVFANGVPFGYSLYLKLALASTDASSQHNVPDLYLICWTLMLVLVGIGFIFKATFIPERFLPAGTVDYFGASHQIWHVLINIGNAFSVISWHYYLSWRETHPCTAPQSF